MTPTKVAQDPCNEPIPVEQGILPGSAAAALSGVHFTRGVLRENAPLLAIVLAYVLARPVLVPGARALDPGVAAGVAGVLGVSALVGCGITILITAARARDARSGGFRSTVAAWGHVARHLLTPSRIAGAAIGCLAVALVYTAYLEWKAEIGIAVPFTWDARLAAADRALHLGRDPWTLLHPLLGRPAVTRGIDLLYHGAWGFALLGVPGLVAWCRDPRDRLRYFIVFCLSWALLGTVVGYALASAGPVYAAQETPEFRELIAYLRSVNATFPLASAGAAAGLWEAFESQAWPRLGISAMPSLHLAIATLTALAAWRSGRLLRWATVAYVPVVLIGSVHLAWHYAIDGYVSIAFVLAAWWVVGRALSPRSGPEAAS